MAKESLFDELDRIKKIVVEHSKFDVDLFGAALADLVTAMRGNKYVSGEITNSESYGYFGSSDIHTTTNKEQLVVTEKNYREARYYSYEPRELGWLVESGLAIRFPSGEQKITFYTPDLAVNKRHVMMDLREFDYVEGFVRVLVQYCYANESKELTKADYDACLAKFLEDYKKEVTTENPTLKLTKETKGE